MFDPIDTSQLRTGSIVNLELTVEPATAALKTGRAYTAIYFAETKSDRCTSYDVIDENNLAHIVCASDVRVLTVVHIGRGA